MRPERLQAIKDEARFVGCQALRLATCIGLILALGHGFVFLTADVNPQRHPIECSCRFCQFPDVPPPDEEHHDEGFRG